MVRRIQIQLIALLFAAVSIAQPNTTDFLVSYSFDDDNIETGPDSFAVFEFAKGTVNLSSLYRFSGFGSVELRDESGDRDFPELQGYFELREKGKLFFHFAILITDPNESLNVALAGPRWFGLSKDGLAFWLKTENSYLYHVSDSMPKKLFLVKRFVWYVVDVSYDIELGIYDLVIHEEMNDEPIVSLSKQPNASNSPGSRVDKFSFIGDKGEDTSNVLYYVDDVIIGVDESIVQLPFVAPGRRKLFIDYLNDYSKTAKEKPVCIPSVDLGDFGIAPDQLQSIKNDGLGKHLKTILKGSKLSLQNLPKAKLENAEKLRSIESWNAGCTALANDDPETALTKFQEASTQTPDGKIYGLSTVLALASLKKWQDVDLLLMQISSDWRDDPRYSVAQAMIGIAKGDLESAENWLNRNAEDISNEFGNESLRRLWMGESDATTVHELENQFPKTWREYIEDSMIAEQYFFLLLWNQKFVEARLFAERMIQRFEALKWNASKWQERLGDAVFLLGDEASAQEYYSQSLKANPNSRNVLLKLSDVYFRLGNLEKEREYREKIYGSLTQ